MLPSSYANIASNVFILRLCSLDKLRRDLASDACTWDIPLLGFFFVAAQTRQLRGIAVCASGTNLSKREHLFSTSAVKFFAQSSSPIMPPFLAGGPQSPQLIIHQTRDGRILRSFFFFRDVFWSFFLPTGSKINPCINEWLNYVARIMKGPNASQT